MWHISGMAHHLEYLALRTSSNMEVQNGDAYHSARREFCGLQDIFPRARGLSCNSGIATLQKRPQGVRARLERESRHTARVSVGFPLPRP
jgi:hypothetical protein